MENGDAGCTGRSKKDQMKSSCARAMDGPQPNDWLAPSFFLCESRPVRQGFQNKCCHAPMFERDEWARLRIGMFTEFNVAHLVFSAPLSLFFLNGP
ncbi:hypothetical protein VCV18_003674 [Metarhizium anisopliae]